MEKINDKLIGRAVELWARKLHTPVFDNGDKSAAGFMGGALATINIQSGMSKIPDIEKAIGIFKNELIAKLKQLRDNPGEGEWFSYFLDTDYGPCKLLADAADKAGIPFSQFSCKSSVSMHRSSVSVSFGYGAERVYHYPLNNGDWLITTVIGSDADMEKIKNDALGDNALNWTVEKEQKTDSERST